MDGLERGVFLKLFNRGGYVLDFTTADFDTFTLEHVGVALCQKYRMSKGRSLDAFLHESEGRLADKLLYDLLRYYEKVYPNFERETQLNEFGKPNYDGGIDYGPIYRRCTEIRSKEMPEAYLSVATKNIQEAFSSDYIDSQLRLMLSMQSSNPTEAIGKAKELVESCCKAIFEANSTEYDKKWDLPKLMKETMKLLKITPDYIPASLPAASSIKTILGNLSGIATALAELRNPYGSGHGKSPNYKGLEERHAKLAVGCSCTLVNFLWDSQKRKETLR